MSASSKTDETSYALGSIETHARLQVRGGPRPALVNSYAKAMDQGASLPAISLARIGAKLYVIDGHHRLEAARSAGLPSIKATSKRMSLDEAHRQALASNHDHGKGLNPKEKRAAFLGYIEAGMHLDEFGLTKSLRTIAAECPVYSFQHIGKKLKELGIHASRDDVKPYRHAGYLDDNDELSLDDLALEELSLRSVFNSHLEAAKASFGILNDASRQSALQALATMIDELAGRSAAPEPVSLLDI